jgi:hypothetical protein
VTSAAIACKRVTKYSSIDQLCACSHNSPREYSHERPIDHVLTVAG